MIIFLSILYCGLLLLSANILTYCFWVAIILGILIIFGIVKIIGNNIFLLISPIILTIASFLLISFLVPKSWAYGFIAVSTPIFISLLYLRKISPSQQGDNDRRRHLVLRENITLNKVLAVTISTISFVALFAVMENLNIFYPIVLSGFFMVAVVFSREILKLSNGEKADLCLIISLIFGLITLEFAWILSLWPLGFFSLGIILSSIFFAFVDSAQQIISKKKIFPALVYNAGLVFFVILIISLTAKWMPI